MPPKRKPPPLDPAIVNKPVPLHKGVVPLNYLAPYLAMGFMPVLTSGAESMCGLYSLKTSLLAAVQLKLPNVDPKLVTIANLRKWLKSEEYNDKVAAWLDNKMYPPRVVENLKKAAAEHKPPYADWKAMPNGYNEMKAALMHENNLEISQLHLLLGVANMKLGTQFRLGVVTQGYWSRWDAEKEEYDNELRETGVHPNREHVAGHPVIFIYNQNNSEIATAHNKRGVADHWEGFTPTATRNEETVRRKWIQDEWAIGHFIDSDMSKGVWVVTQDNGGGEGELNVMAGHFVRNYEPPPKFVVPEDSFHMQASNRSDYPSLKVPGESGHGLIQKSKLREVKRHPNVPTGGSFKDPPRPSQTR